MRRSGRSHEARTRPGVAYQKESEARKPASKGRKQKRDVAGERNCAETGMLRGVLGSMSGQKRGRATKGVGS